MIDLKEEIRALSWKQPFAQMMLHGKIETRVWDAKYRGLVLICASKTPYRGIEICNLSGWDGLDKIIKTVGGLVDWPTSQAIAVGRLVDSRLMTVEDEDKCFISYRAPWIETKKYLRFKHIESTSRIEEYFEYKEVQKKLWCHIYADVRPIHPFEWHGVQGWKTIDDETKSKIKFI